MTKFNLVAPLSGAMTTLSVVGVLGIEPSLHPPKGRVLPVYYTPGYFSSVFYLPWDGEECPAFF